MFYSNSANDGTGGAISTDTNSALNCYRYLSLHFMVVLIPQYYLLITKQHKMVGLFTYIKSNVAFEGSLTVEFHNNEATLDGAINCNSNSKITSKENPNIIFSHNNANLGGAIYIVMAKVSITDKSKFKFIDNTAYKMVGLCFFTNSTNLF